MLVSACTANSCLFYHDFSMRVLNLIHFHLVVISALITVFKVSFFTEVSECVFWNTAVLRLPFCPLPWMPAWLVTRFFDLSPLPPSPLPKPESPLLFYAEKITNRWNFPDYTFIIGSCCCFFSPQYRNFQGHLSFLGIRIIK